MDLIGITGLSFEIGLANDSYGETNAYFRLAGGIGFDIGPNLILQEMKSDSPISLSDLEDQDIEYNIDLLFGYTYGGDQGNNATKRANNWNNGMGPFTEFGAKYTTKGISTSTTDNNLAGLRQIDRVKTSRSILKFINKPGASTTWGVTYMLE